jgi:hypothetical protein
MKKPWYREPFVWLVILFPASAVIGGMITISLAISSDDGLVIDDYYKRGLEINRTLERDKAAARHGIQATLSFNVEHQFIHLNLNAHPDYRLPDQITLYFRYQTRSGFDRSVMLERTGNNFYQSRLPELIVGKWQIQLAADDWRLLKSVQMPVTQEVSIGAEK